MLSEIRELQKFIMSKQKDIYKRYFFETIAFDTMTGILGARGVGKTTFLLWYLKNAPISNAKKLYVSADSIKIDSLFDLAKRFQKEGGELLIIDEIHKYAGFEAELKKIYDFLNLQVVFSGSSALEIDNAKADLSRRVIVHEIEGMSFREFLEIKHGMTFATYDLKEILEHHVDIAFEVSERFSVEVNFKEYLQYGYYPFYFDKKSHYFLKLNETINTVLEVDIPSIFPIEYHNITNLKKLIKLICNTPPYTPNIKELLAIMGLGEDYRTLYRYIDYLHKAKILKAIRTKNKGDNIFTKPDKIYLNNTNLHYGHCNDANIGTVREVFFASMLFAHTLTIPKKGDFLVDERYLFEIGGKNKSFKPIKDLPDTYVASDDVEIGSGNKIPLWLFGFLY